MRFKVPFTLASVEKIKRKPIILRKLIRHKKKSKLEFYLKNSDTGITREQYLNICLRGFILRFVLLNVILTTILALLKIKFFFLFSLAGAFVFSTFVFFTQIIYPKIFLNRKQRNIEKNLISALENMLVQLNSGIPLFSIMVNISESDYGELSHEFGKAVKKINAGIPQIEVLEELGENNPSPFFRRTLWQLSNGMKAGSEIDIIIKDSVNSLNEEQLIQIQTYGNKLNPLIMFYMLISVILPALAISFLTIVASLVNLPSTTTTLMFIGLFIFVIFIQIMFIGIIRSSRPSLLN